MKNIKTNMRGKRRQKQMKKDELSNKEEGGRRKGVGSETTFNKRKMKNNVGKKAEMDKHTTKM